MLWKLIEKKFRDLGEFVEGKEKQKMIVDRTYESAKELFSMFQTRAALDGDDSESEEDEDLRNLLWDAHIEAPGEGGGLPTNGGSRGDGGGGSEGQVAVYRRPVLRR